MSFLTWILIALGSLLIYSGYKSKNPARLIADTLQGKSYG